MIPTTYERLQQLRPSAFKRPCGVHRETFHLMVSVLRPYLDCQGKQGNSILLHSIGCPAREVVVHQGKVGRANFLIVQSCDSDIKLEKTYTVTGTVRQ